ncbi:MAG: FecR domain-containing protein [Nitrospirae bacterium]|nr:FecR domain-containing protein [Nitrospirota bacterium]
MKMHKVFFVALLLCLLPSYSFASGLGELRVTLVEGDVQIKTDETSDWVPASINMPLKEEDMIWVPEEGRVELQLRNGTSVRLDGNSSLEILRLESDSSQLYLNSGRAYVYFRGSKKDVIQLDTPVSSVRGFEKSIFNVDVDKDGDTDVSVLRGYVYAENRNGRIKVTENYTLALTGETRAELGAIGPADDWEEWNKERNRRLYERRYSSRYLPDELETYSNDFDDNGKWVYTRDYGYVWTPTVMVSAGWAPYRHGRWTWIGGDYVWVSYEPWGWAPYHYGRWSFVASIGWFWVPPVRGSVYWGPGFVGWVNTPNYVAWVPLAPGEIYYGYGNYGPHSVNLININIANISINQIYRHARIPHAVTILHPDTFLRGRHVDIRIKDNPFLRDRPSIGRPLLRPERATFMPVVRDIPQAKLPPAPISRLKPKELREARPFVREQNRSVFRPDAPQKTMPFNRVKERTGGDLRMPEKDTAPRRQVQPLEGLPGRDDEATTTRKGIGKPPQERLPVKPSAPSDLPVAPLKKQGRVKERSSGEKAGKGLSLPEKPARTKGEVKSSSSSQRRSVTRQTKEVEEKKEKRTEGGAIEKPKLFDVEGRGRK